MDSATAGLLRLAKHKRREPVPTPMLGPELIGFFKNSVEKRHTKLGAIAEKWAQLIPATLQEHCALESFQSGTLKVIVDSSSHLYELKQLLLAGMNDQLMLACRPAGLRKITLKIGRWYRGEGNDRKINF
jgi:hypothetical protein